MSADLIIAGGFVGLVVLLLIAGGVMIFFSGKKDEKLDQAREDAQDATKQVERHTEPMPTDRDYLDRLRRAKERLARLRDRATKRRGD